MKIPKSLALAVLLSITSCIQSSQRDNVLLIIGYNFAHYESVSLLRKIYEPYYANIVFYGPKEHPEVRAFNYHQYLIYESIADAMKRSPDYEGYLFVMDDCIFHPWFMANLDTSKIWYPLISFGTTDRGFPIRVSWGKNAHPWPTWQGEWGWKPVENAYAVLPEQYKKILTHNYGAGNVGAAYADILYIPAQYKDQFIELVDIFYKNNVHLELAVPTIASCLSSKKEWVWLRGWGPMKNHTLQTMKYDVYFNHPIKLSDANNRAFVEKYFAKKLVTNARLRK